MKISFDIFSVEETSVRRVLFSTIKTSLTCLILFCWIYVRC